MPRTFSAGNDLKNAFTTHAFKNIPKKKKFFRNSGILYSLCSFLFVYVMMWLTTWVNAVSKVSRKKISTEIYL
jgi:hypothetical protein